VDALPIRAPPANSTVRRWPVAQTRPARGSSYFAFALDRSRASKEGFVFGLLYAGALQTPLDVPWIRGQRE
jgi:hypothetical protein